MSNNTKLAVKIALPYGERDLKKCEMIKLVKKSVLLILFKQLSILIADLSCQSHPLNGNSIIVSEGACLRCPHS